MKKNYKTTGNRGLFDEQETYQKLSNIGNPLEKISSVVDFVMFRDKLESKVKKWIFRTPLKLLWILSIITFFMSAALDNLTTTIVMVALLSLINSQT